MHKLGVEEWLVLSVMFMYTGAKTVERTVSSANKGKFWNEGYIQMQLQDGSPDKKASELTHDFAAYFEIFHNILLVLHQASDFTAIKYSVHQKGIVFLPNPFSRHLWCLIITVISNCTARNTI